MNKKWEYIEVDEEKVQTIADKHNISEIIARVLLNRGIVEDDTINNFLYPKLENLYDPFLLNDMEIAVDRIIECKEKNEKITIYGDYDVDGITSIATLSKFLTELGIENDYYLPNRLDEGYGLNNNALDKIVRNGTKLLITVDCGISAYNEIEYAKEIGMEVVVTDHHECPEVLPEAIAIIDAKCPNNTYPFNSLAGVGVSFKVIQALCMKLGMPADKYLKYLDIVCLGTVADIVPLVEENRVIVKYGLEYIKNTKNVGLKALIETSGYKTIDSSAISFGLAPRINACGRMGQAELALDMLLTDSMEEAMRIAEHLQIMNKERQEVEKLIMEDATKVIEENKLYSDNVIVIGNENWHHGVIGIVASKITETYYKPSILVCFEGDEGKGSGRSVDGFDLHEALSACGDKLLKYGGHEMAIGLTLKKEEFQNFKNAIIDFAKDKLPEDLMPIVKYDAEISTKDISKDTIESLKLLEPYGEANNSPIFVYKNIKVDSIRTLSNDKHLKLNVKDGNFVFSAIAFNMGEKKDSIRMGDKVDVLHYLELNRYNGFESVQLNVKDIKKSL